MEAQNPEKRSTIRSVFTYIIDKYIFEISGKGEQSTKEKKSDKPEVEKRKNNFCRIS